MPQAKKQGDKIKRNTHQAYMLDDLGQPPKEVQRAYMTLWRLFHRRKKGK